MGDFTVQYLNLSATQSLTRDWMAMPDPVERVKGSTPLPVLDASSSTTQGYSLNLAGEGVTTSFEFGAMWRLANGWRFGVLVRVPVEVGPFGTSPYYHVAADDNAPVGADPKWAKLGGSDPYQWDETDLGLIVTAQSQAGHSSIEITVTATDPPAP